MACKNDVCTLLIWDMKNVLKASKNVQAYLPDVTTASGNLLSFYNVRERL